MDSVRLIRPIARIDDYTPVCVVVNLVSRTGLGYESEHIFDNAYRRVLVKTTYRESPYISKNEKLWLNEEYSYIARYVNFTTYQWTRSKLLRAYNHIITNSFPGSESEPIQIDRLGSINPINIDNFDEIMLYNHLTKLGVSFTPEMTFLQMSLIYLMHFPHLGRYALLSNTDIPIKELAGSIVLGNCSNIKGSWTTLHKVRLTDFPKTEEEAILAGLSKGIDLTLTDSPLVEYHNFSDQHAGEPTLQYIGEVSRKVEKINKLRLKFGSYFNPIIPAIFYKLDIMENIAWIEGFDMTTYHTGDLYTVDTKMRIELIHDDLTHRYLMSNFHHLLQPEVTAIKTHISHDEFNEVDAVSIVCYGVLSYNSVDLTKMMGNSPEDSSMKVYTLKELTLIFRHERAFQDSITKEDFPEYSIIKLRNLCLGLTKSKFINPETRKDSVELIQEIYLTKELNSGLMESIGNWREAYDNSGDRTQTLTRKVIGKLMDAAMYMRSWNGPGHPYPVNVEIHKDVSQVEEDVFNSLSEFNELDSGLDENVQVGRLPLQSFEGDKFSHSDSTFEGFTISERIGKVAEGNKVSEQYSCVRLSSGWFIASAYYYLQLIGHRPSFNIEEVISTG